MSRVHKSIFSTWLGKFSDSCCSLRMDDNLITCENKVLSTWILNALHGSWKKGESCDVIIKVEDREFKAHKWLLTSLSGYFTAMFRKGGFVENESRIVELQGISKETFAIILDFLYGNDQIFKNNDEVTLVDALRIADMLLIDIFKSFCDEYIKAKSTSYFGKCFALANQLGNEQAANKIVNHICTYFDEQNIRFTYISLLLAEKCLKQFARNQFTNLVHPSLTNLLFKATYEKGIHAIRKMLNFVFRWAACSAFYPSPNDHVEKLLEIIPFCNLPLQNVRSFLVGDTCTLKHISDSGKMSVSNMILSHYDRLFAAIVDLELDLLLVEQKEDALFSHEYDFINRCYKKSDILIGIEDIHFFHMSEKTIYLLKSNSQVTSLLACNRRPKLCCLVDGFTWPKENGLVVDMYVMDKVVYFWCFVPPNSCKIVSFNVVSKVTSSTKSVEIVDPKEVETMVKYAGTKALKKISPSIDKITCSLNKVSVWIENMDQASSLKVTNTKFRYTTDIISNHGLCEISSGSSVWAVKNVLFPEKIQLMLNECDHKSDKHSITSLGFIPLEMAASENWRLLLIPKSRKK